MLLSLPPLLTFPTPKPPNNPLVPLRIDPFSFAIFVRPNEASNLLDIRFAFRLR